MVVGGSTSGSYGTATTAESTPDDRISLVVNGTDTYSFSILPVNRDPNEYNVFPAMDGEPLQLQRVPDPQHPGTMMLQLTDQSGDVTDFYDLQDSADGYGNPRPVPFARGDLNATHEYGQFKSFTAANGTTVTANYDSTYGQIATEVISNPATPTQQATLTFNYSSVSNDLVMNANGSPARLISSIVWTNNGQEVRTVNYGYYTGRISDPNNPGQYIDDPNGRPRKRSRNRPNRR